MTDKKIPRARVSDFRPVGGAAAALGRRTSRQAPEAPVAARKASTKPTRVVVPYFGNDDDTPMIQMLKATRPAADNFRTGDNIHVSDVIKRCVRKIALMRRMNMKHPSETIMDGQGITFAIGDAVHDYVKGRFIKGHPGAVYARWSCACGTTTHDGTFSSRPKPECPQCGLAVDKHNEISYIHPEYRLKGTPDLLLWLDQYAAIFVCELKSMAAEMFKELVRPIPDHTVQVALYWHILKHLKIPVVDRVSLVYVNKEYSFKLPYKEFMVDPTKVDLSPYWEDLEALKEADEGGALPLRTMCGSLSAPEAKKCPVCVTCFGST